MIVGSIFNKLCFAILFNSFAYRKIISHHFLGNSFSIYVLHPPWASYCIAVPVSLPQLTSRAVGAVQHHPSIPISRDIPTLMTSPLSVPAAICLSATCIVYRATSSSPQIFRNSNFTSLCCCCCSHIHQGWASPSVQPISPFLVDGINICSLALLFSLH